MDNYEIIIPSNSPEKKFLYDSIANLDECEAYDYNYKNYDKIFIKLHESNYEKLLDIISDLITSFYKFRILNNLFRNNKIGILDHFAFLGTLLSVDKETEINIVRQVAFGIRSFAPLSLLDFRLRSLKSNWENLLELAKTLTQELKGIDELYELISYFISSSSTNTKVTITDSNPPKLCFKNKIISPIPLTENNDINLLITTMREHPSHIVIKNQDILDKNLLTTLRALGQ